MIDCVMVSAETGPLFTKAVGRLIAKSREVSKPRDSGLDVFNRSEIWQAAAEMPVKFQSGTIIITSNLTTSRLHKI